MEDPNKLLNTIKSLKKDFDDLSQETENNELNNELNNSLNEIKSKLGKKYPNLSDNYPSLFNLVFNPVTTWEKDLKDLTQMVNLASKVKENKISQHDASVKVGQQLVDKWVKPQLDKTK